MDTEQLRRKAAAGELDLEKLVDVIEKQQQVIADLEAKNRELQAKIDGKNPTERLDEAYSARAEEKRKSPRRKRSKAKRRGRFPTSEKIKQAQRTEKVFPDGVDPADCVLSHTRVAWRLENGRAVLVAYEIFRQGNRYGRPAGLHGRGQFGIEVMVALAYQVYCLGLSIDKACNVLSFFQQLKLSKSQADALLNQLARSWESEFDSLCTLLANAAVVHCDETSWSINSVWAFVNEQLTVIFYGVHKDAQTLGEILDKSVFGGTLVSDNAAVYKNFSQSQKCWAHLLRKAIKLTLQAPENTTYRDFADRLLKIYRKAKRSKADRRMGPAGRLRRVSELEDEVLTLCAARVADKSTDGDDAENDYRRLCNELTQLTVLEELFVFVTEEGVDGTNNAAERQLRGDAISRRTGRTNKTPAGAKRQSIISSVLQSIGKQLGDFTLESVINEVHGWWAAGRSCFDKQLANKGLSPPPRDSSLLDSLIPNTS